MEFVFPSFVRRGEEPETSETSKIFERLWISDHFDETRPHLRLPLLRGGRFMSPLLKGADSCDVGAVGRQCGEATIIQRASNREMVERLPLGLRMNPEYPMYRIIKETADTC